MRDDIERLLIWAYDELSKRHTSSAEGIWDRIGGLGAGTDQETRTAAQRYAHFGLPHPDAEAIERAVDALGDEPVDWTAPEVCGELHALVLAHLQRHDVLQVESLPGGLLKPGRPSVSMTAVMVRHHAVLGTRPDWGKDATPKPNRIQARQQASGVPVVEGRRLRYGWYETGAHCPLRWVPSPIDVVRARARYVAWHRALARLAGSLSLTEHVPQPPKAPAAPWLTPEPARAILAVKAMLPVPVSAAPRPRALPRRKLRLGAAVPDGGVP